MKGFLDREKFINRFPDDPDMKKMVQHTNYSKAYIDQILKYGAKLSYRFVYKMEEVYGRDVWDCVMKFK